MGMERAAHGRPEQPQNSSGELDEAEHVSAATAGGEGGLAEAVVGAAGILLQDF